VLSDNSFQAFGESLRGELIQPDDQRYDRDFGSPAFYGIQTMPFPVLQSAFDNLYPPDLQWYRKADFVNELREKAIALHVEHGSRLPTMHSAMNLYPINGAAHRVGRKDTRVQLSGSYLGRSDRRRRSRSRQKGTNYNLGESVLGCFAPLIQPAVPTSIS
jgi:hypothetical protein